jgi:transposase
MQEYTLRSEHATTVALDQHARSVTLAALDLSTGEARAGRLADCPSAEQIVGWASWATGPLRFVYESGPCGFQLAREIRSMGIDCDVIAMTSIPRSAEARRLKDDRRDAQSLLEAVTAPGSRCRAVHVPSEESEAARDLCRAYYDAVLATKRLKMQFSAMPLRHGFVWNERTPKGGLRATWTREYIRWARSIRLPEDAENRALKFYLGGVLDGLDRCGEMRRECLALSEAGRFKPYVDALTRLKGVDRMTALTYVATMDDFSRFRNGRSVSKYFGLTPTRHDSGERVGGGGRITKAGDTTVRKAVVEGLAGLPSFNKSQKRLPRGCEASAAVEAEARLCNARNVDRYRSLVGAGKRPNVAKVAVASELVRQMWVLGGIVRGELEQG